MRNTIFRKYLLKTITASKKAVTEARVRASNFYEPEGAVVAAEFTMKSNANAGNAKLF
jgi:hypothetical protein